MECQQQGRVSSLQASPNLCHDTTVNVDVLGGLVVLCIAVHPLWPSRLAIVSVSTWRQLII